MWAVKVSPREQRMVWLNADQGCEELVGMAHSVVCLQHASCTTGDRNDHVPVLPSKLVERQ